MDSDDGVTALLEQFQAVLSGDPHAGPQAEENIKSARSEPGFPVALTRIILAEEVPVPFRQFATVVLKQFVGTHWKPGTRLYEGPTCRDEDKELVRENLPMALADSERAVRVGAAKAICDIAEYDFPESWNNLFSLLMECMGSNSADAVHGAMRCLVDLAKDMSETHMPNVVPLLLPELLRVFMNEDGIFGERDQMRAISIFHSLLKSMEPLLKQNTQAVFDMMREYMPVFLDAFGTVVAAEDTLESSCGLKIAVVRVLTELSVTYHKLVADALVPILPAVFSTLQRNEELFNVAVLNEGALVLTQDSDGDVMGFEALIMALVEFIHAMTGRKRFRRMLMQNLEETISMIICFLQLTDDQIAIWENDPEQYIADHDEEVTRAYSIRVAASDFLNQLTLDDIVGYEFTRAATVATVGAAVQRIEESNARAEAGDPLWWRMREAAFFALGHVYSDQLMLMKSGEFEFDVEGFLGSVLLPDLEAENQSPFLLGRALWTSSYYGHLVSPDLAGAFAEATVAGLDPDNMLPIRVCACKALHIFAMQAKETIAPHLGTIVDACILIAQQSAEMNSLLLALETLSRVLGVRTDALLDLESRLSPFVLAVWIRYPSHHIIAAQIVDIIEELCGVEAYFWPLVERVMPTILSSFENFDVEAEMSGFVAAAVDLLKIIVENAPEPLNDTFLNEAFPRLIELIKNTPDGTTVQNGTECLITFIRKAANELANSQEALEQVVSVVEFLLGDSMSEDAAAYTGQLIVALFKRAGDQLGDILYDILRACADRLATAQYQVFIETLVVVFAQLINTQGAPAIVDFLGNYTTSTTNENGLQVLLNKWLETESDFAGAYEIKVSVAALCSLMAPLDPRLRELPVVGWINPTRNIVTRSSQQQDTYTYVPLPVKIFQVLINQYRDQRVQVIDVDDEYSGYSDGGDGDDDYLLDIQAIPGIGSNFMYLSDCVGLGLDIPDFEDPDAKDDPIFHIQIGPYLEEFFLQYASANMGDLESIGSQLLQGDQAELERILNAGNDNGNGNGSGGN